MESGALPTREIRYDNSSHFGCYFINGDRSWRMGKDAMPTIVSSNLSI
jgi:hypothetical protein